MKPFFEDPALTLYQGDALAVLQSFPPLCVDAVITDPPYSSGGLMLSARQADPAVKYQNNGTVKTYPPMFGDNRDQRSFIMWATLWLAECWRVARDGSPLLMFSDWRQLPAMTDAVQAAGWTWRGVVVWHKRTGRPLRGEFRREAEFVIFASKGRLGYRGPRCLPGLYAHTVDHKKKNSSTPPPGFSEVGFVPSRKSATVNCTLVAHQYSWAAQLAGNATLCRSMRKRKENLKFNFYY